MCFMCYTSLCKMEIVNNKFKKKKRKITVRKFRSCSTPKNEKIRFFVVSNTPSRDFRFGSRWIISAGRIKTSEQAL